MEEERKVSVLKDQKAGKVKIADEVIAIIADLAISDVKGVAMRKGKRGYGKGISVRIDGNDVYCDVALVLKHGTKVNQVAVPVQQRIKSSIENMLEMNVKEVNVCIVGVQKEKQAQSE